MTQVGCYDQQIDDLNNRIDELTTGKIASIESQYSSLQTTLSALQSKDAAMETKNAELQAAIATLENSLDGFLTKSQLDATLTSYATVAELGKYALADDVEDAIAAAGEALEESFENAFNAAAAAFAAGEAGNTSLEKSIVAALNAAKAETEKAIAAAVAEGGVISTAVAKQLADANAELAKHISARLTSLQVIPTLFVNGVETVELNSFAYKAKTVSAAEAVTTATATTTTSSLATTVAYYVSPAQVTTEDIDAENVEFLFHEATTTRATDDEAAAVPAHVASAKIEAGKLFVSLVRTATDAKVNLGLTKAWVGAVKVPIAAKHLAEGEADAAVISDYVALAEKSVEPLIAAKIDKNAKQDKDDYTCTWIKHSHFSSSFAKAQAAGASQFAYFDTELNLSEMVTGCDWMHNEELTPATLAAAGLKFQFAAPTAAYTPGVNDADQQKFITVYEKDGVWYAKAQLPNGVADNKAAIDKTPIVRVELVDTNNKNAVVDVRWFKVKWIDYTEVVEPYAPIVLEAPIEFNYALSCEDFKGDVTWTMMINDILAKFENNAGMSYADFVKNYTAVVAVKDVEDKAVVNTGSVAMKTSNEAPDAPVLTWTATTEQIGTVINTKGELTVTEKTILVKFQSVDEHKYPSYYVTFKMNITAPYIPVINGYQSAMWAVDGVKANVYPVQYNTPGAQTTCVYNYDFDLLFTESKLVKGMIKCANNPKHGNEWSVAWTNVATANAVNLIDNSTDHTADADGVAKAADIKMVVNHTDAGKAILGKDADVDVWAEVNDYNKVLVKTFNMFFVEPLKINTTLEGAYFVDQVVSGSTVDCKNAFSLTDFKNYIVKDVADNATKPELEKYTQSLWNYYMVETPTWDLTKAVINIKRDANNDMVVVDDLAIEDCINVLNYFGEGCLAMAADGQTLIWKNVGGTKVEKQAKVYIPVSVSHKWGKTTATVVIDLYPEAPAN